jgi:AbrB family looped-hinge helix DNA binding protein
MRVTEKGQVTIPKEIRDRLGIAAGSEVAFVTTEGGAMLVKLDDAGVHKISSFEEWAASVQGTMDTQGMTTDEYVDWIRGPREDLDHR